MLNRRNFLAGVAGLLGLSQVKAAEPVNVSIPLNNLVGSHLYKVGEAHARYVLEADGSLRCTGLGDLWDKQKAIIHSPARLKALWAGRRWGKTRTCIDQCFDYALRENGSRCAVVEPNKRLAKSAFKEAIAAHPAVFIASNSQRLSLRFMNGSEIRFLSSRSPSELCGSTYNCMAIDNAEQVSEKAFFGVLFPCLMDQKGTLLATGLIRGNRDEHWFTKFYDKDAQARWKYRTVTGYSFQSNEGMAQLAAVPGSVTKDIWEKEF